MKGGGHTDKLSTEMEWGGVQEHKKIEKLWDDYGEILQLSVVGRAICMWKDRIHLFLKSVLSLISPLNTQVAIKMNDFVNRFSPGSFGGGTVIICFVFAVCWRSVTTETWTGTQLGFAIRACDRNEKYFLESPGLFRHYFEIHHNDPVLLANAIKKWAKNYEETVRH